MQSNTAWCNSGGVERINQFALVSYIPDPLGSFLDALRLHLVPDCKPHAHVTILPPRPVNSECEEAIREIHSRAIVFEPFTINLGDVAKFEGTDVVYIELASGTEELRALYEAINTGPLQYCEKFCYCPHITLAQRLPKEIVERTFEEARAAWKAYPYDRSFRVETLSFVQNTSEDRWIDLDELQLRPCFSMAPVTRKGYSKRPG